MHGAKINWHLNKSVGKMMVMYADDNRATTADL